MRNQSRDQVETDLQQEDGLYVTCCFSYLLSKNHQDDIGILKKSLENHLENCVNPDYHLESRRSLDKDWKQREPCSLLSSCVPRVAARGLPATVSDHDNEKISN